MNNFDIAISQLTSLEKFHICLGLDRVQALLKLFGNPQDSIKCIHVAGTNGKGSSCAMLESVLRSAGYKTGLYTSPHLIDYTERIKVDGQDISQEDFAETVLRVMEHTEPQNIVHYDAGKLPVFGGDKPKFNREIKALYKKNFQGKSVHHRILGEIQLTKTGVKKTINICQTVFLKLINKIDELIKNGKYVKTELSYKDRIDGIVRFHTLQATIDLDGSLKTLEIKIGEDKKCKKLYFFKEQSSSTLPGKTGVTEASEYIITNENRFFNPVYPLARIPATEFEILTVAAFLYFHEKKVDYAVIETGLGGRLDATNIIKKPELCIITDLGPDHTARLGETIEEIAAEKAGIIKEGVPIITLKDNAGLEAIKEKAELCCSKLILADEKDVNLSETNLKGTWQGRNLALVKAALTVLRENDTEITAEEEKMGLQSIQWRGRFEYIEEENLLIDAAHNPPGARALRESLDRCFPKGDRIFIYSSLNTKDFRTVAQSLFRQEDIVIVTCNTSNACEKPDIITSFLQENGLCKKTFMKQEVAEAMKLSYSLRRRGELIVFAGSIYTIGEFLATKKGGAHKMQDLSKIADKN